jgi:hypothetical protein
MKGLLVFLALAPQDLTDKERIAALEKRVADLEKIVWTLEQQLRSLGGVRSAPGTPVVRQGDPAATCAGNLMQLWSLQITYMSQFGGRMKAMPREPGPGFWIKLTETIPPLLPEAELARLVCPLSGEKPRPGFTTYRGPAESVAKLAGGDIVGCCDPEYHPDRSITVLFKTGEVRVVKPGDEVYSRALDTTAGRPERQAILAPAIVKGSLKKVLSAQADFRANDRDGNKMQDFWVADVSMLYRTVSELKNPIRLIPEAVAAADAAPVRESPETAPAVAPAPVAYHGYFFKALKGWKEAGKTSAYDAGGGRNPSRFGVVAYPAEYAAGRLTYVANENNILFGADLGGKLLDGFPSNDELKKDWKKLD